VNLSDTHDKNIYETLTETYIQDFKDLINDKLHPVACNCWLCLWRKYKETTKKHKGKKYDLVTFLIFSLISDIKLAHLVDKGIAKKTTKNGQQGWQYPYGHDFRAPYWKKLDQTLEALPGCALLPLPYLKNYAKTDKTPLYCKGKGKTKFLKLLDNLDDRIFRDRQKQEVKKPGRKKKNLFWLSREFAEFIYQQTDHKATQRQLLRRFTTLRKDNLKEISLWLQTVYDIYSKKEGRSVVYYGTIKDSKIRYWKLGI